MWKKGVTPRYTSFSVQSLANHAVTCVQLATRLRCVSMAPFEMPVVPPVYCRTARSVGLTGTGASIGWASFSNGPQRWKRSPAKVASSARAALTKRSSQRSGRGSVSRNDVRITCCTPTASAILGQQRSETSQADGHFRARILQLQFRFAQGVERTGRHGNPARKQDAEKRDRELRTIREHDGNTIAFFHAQAAEDRRQPPRVVVHFAIRESPSPESHGRVIGPALECLNQQPRNADLRQLQDARNVRVVV